MTPMTPKIKIDPVQQYQQAYKRLVAERDAIEARLKAIDAALSCCPSSTPAVSKTRLVDDERSWTSLAEAVKHVLQHGPMTKEEILDAVQQSGYTFQTKDPMNSLGSVLYGRKSEFRRIEDGAGEVKFQLEGSKRS